jgi:hypothetical protein
MKAELVAPFVTDPAVPQDTSVISLVFSPDSHTVATTFMSGALRKQEIVRYEVETGTRLTVFEPPPTLGGLITAGARFSSDGRYHVNARSRSLLTRYKLTLGSGEEGVDTRNLLDVWDTRTGERRTIPGVHEDDILALTIARQGTIVATGSTRWGSHTSVKLPNDSWATIDNHGFIKLWDLKQGGLEKS